MIVWESPIWIYLWLAGMAGGAYLAAFLIDRFSGGRQKPLLRMATVLALPITLLGVLLLLVDLGKPFRFWRLLTEFDHIGSAMWLGTWFLLAFVACTVVMIVVWYGASRYISSEGARLSLGRLADAVSWIGAIFAVLVIVYTGVLLASSNQALWSSTFMIPALFVTSAVSTGVALLIVTALVSRKGVISNKMISRLAELDVLVIMAELLVLVTYTVWLGVTNLGGAAEGLRMLLTGSISAAFWTGAVALAILIPLALDLPNWGKELRERGSTTWFAIMASGVAVIIGGLLLRMAIVRAGQMVV
jgi:polysulfide reductase chain C